MILAGTGHRSSRLRGRHDVVRSLTRKFLEEHRPTEVISGLAEGFDQLLAIEALDLGIPLCSAMPWKGYGSHWDKEHREILEEILKRSARVVVTSPVERYNVSVYFTRNRWMVNNATDLIVCWDGGRDGGTYDAVEYALEISRPMHQLPWLADVPAAS